MPDLKALLERESDRAQFSGAALDATLSVPRLVPVGGIGNELAREFVAAAGRALTRRG